jgi:hypothetical protein
MFEINARLANNGANCSFKGPSRRVWLMQTAIRRSFAYWDDIAVHCRGTVVRSSGHDAMTGKV